MKETGENQTIVTKRRAKTEAICHDANRIIEKGNTHWESLETLKRRELMLSCCRQ